MSNGFEFGKNREEKIDKFLDYLAWHFHTKQAIDYTARATEKLVDKLGELDRTIKQADQASGKVTNALNRLTLWGVIVAGAGVLVAVGNLCFEIIKYIHGN